jgi:phosphinothricin acetyltransferase
MTHGNVRNATLADLPRLLEIYNHYVVHTPITFDVHALTLEERKAWFEQFADSGRHRLLVWEGANELLGYACSHSFRVKKAYDTTVELTCYCAPEAGGRGIGSELYTALFAALEREDIRTFVAGITLPNAASIALHRRFGFVSVGTMREVGRKFDRYWDVAWFQRSASG